MVSFGCIAVSIGVNSIIWCGHTSVRALSQEPGVLLLEDCGSAELPGVDLLSVAAGHVLCSHLSIFKS